MTGRELYEKETSGSERPWDELLPSTQEGWDRLAASVTAWEEAIARATAPE